MLVEEDAPLDGPLDADLEDEPLVADLEDDIELLHGSWQQLSQAMARAATRRQRPTTKGKHGRLHAEAHETAAFLECVRAEVEQQGVLHLTSEEVAVWADVATKVAQQVDAALGGTSRR